MPYSGSGTFQTYTPGNPVVTSTVISSTAFNATMTDFASGLSNVLARDGQAPATANIPFGSFKITGLGSGTARTDGANFGQAQDGAYAYLTGVAGTDTITANLSTPALAAYATGMVVRFIAAATNTGAVTINVNGIGAKSITKNGTTALAAGDLLINAAYEVIYDGTRFQLANRGLFALSDALRGYLGGCILSTAGASATMSIAAGVAQDSTNAAAMTLAATSKTTAAWALGAAAGGLDTGAIANSTWYHFYVIRRPDTGVVDVTFSTNATTPTLPTNYTQYRRIGSGKTTAGALWTGFAQTGDRFSWADPVADVAAANPGTAAVTRTLTVPTGVVVTALVNVGQFIAAGWAVVTGLYLSPLTATDSAPFSNTTGFTVSSGKGSSDMDFNYAEVVTNTSAQIRSRVNASEAGGTIYISTLGWIDTRGKDS